MSDVPGSPDRGEWKSRWGFVLAAAGSAVGLGNIWKFPYITGENGGGLFVLIYLFCIALVGLPIMMAEIMIGRAAQKQPVAAFHELEGKRTPWAAIGWLGVITGFIILSYYIVVAGWAIDYTLKSVTNFTADIADEAQIEGKKYVVTTDLDDMREVLAKRRAAKSQKDLVAAEMRRAKPSVWEGHARYTEAMGAAHEKFMEAQPGAPDGEVEAAQARARGILFEDEILRSQVEEAEGILVDINRIKTEELEAATAHYAGVSGPSVRAEAEDVKRREFIAGEVGARFGALASDGWTSSFWALLFMVVTILVVAGGISKGIERTCTILMPTLIFLIVCMVLYGATRPGFQEALRFVFYPDPTKLEASGILEALGHAFFTLSLGMGAMITYGSYQRDKEGLVSQSILITIFDTVIALLACMMMFPILFSYGQEAGAGPGLVFVSMPLAFAEIGTGGMLLALLFFGLLVFAAITSAISLLEVVCSYFIDERGWARRRAAVVVGTAVFLFGLPVAFASDSGFLLESISSGFGKDYFSVMDYLASNWMLPLGGLFISIYAGWVMPARLRDVELQGLAPIFVQGWLLLVRFVAPLFVIIVLLQKVGIFDANEWFR